MGGANSPGFSTLLDIDKLTRAEPYGDCRSSFSTLLDIDKLTRFSLQYLVVKVLVLCWILINLHLTV